MCCLDEGEIQFCVIIGKRVKELKADLPIAVEVNGLMSEYAAKSLPGNIRES